MMATSREKIIGTSDMSKSGSRKWQKRQMNKYMRRQPKRRIERKSFSPTSGESNQISCGSTPRLSPCPPHIPRPAIRPVESVVHERNDCNK